ncbi:hypothetical protein RWH43_12785 [Microbacterium sp. KSW2-21]|uniref:Swt1-like HEPN domain-containing protein n=1 Tax=Microbacterium algihabitans TaxID=3075992 RepID=A0ABU3RYJ9_9MICO|nr:hypothetical protein [Microbacterium sp. KSW2-21]MDU0327635.1 hypothetical protein [Microbacterium sp. KSW2-21]
MREAILDGLPGVHVSIDDRNAWSDLPSESSLVITDLDRCATSHENILGEVRESALAALDDGRMVCLVSRAPRLAFRSVPGSSVLEDAALAISSPLDREELEVADGDPPPAGWPLPAVSFGGPLTAAMLTGALAEMGEGLVTALDHAIFEVDPRSADGLQFLSAREVEGLRGAGLVKLDSSGVPRLTTGRSTSLLKEALSEHISHSVSPSDRLADVVSGLWLIERLLRAAVRTAAIDKFSDAWRSNCLGGLNAEVLRRAQLDSSAAAKTVGDLRDPLEWLTLGELVDIIRGNKFDQLGVESAIWRKLQEQLIPVRNRLAHVRLLKAQDHEVVQMWSSTLKGRLNL